MSDQIRFTIDGKVCTAEKGQTIVEAAKDNGVFIPVLCHYEGLAPAGTCRICTVNVNGRPVAACTTQVAEGMEVANDTEELREGRKMMLEMLFVEGNHFCPSCEKSGDCELQALAYRYQMLAPRFQFLFQQRALDASHPKIMLERNRCIMCKRCIRGIRAKDGRAIFALSCRGGRAEIIMDDELASQLTDEDAQKAMDMCPVGAILRREKGFDTPIGKRKYDTQPIGSDIEGKA
jgi:[NiFe] hydrogenase diaphorase moiety small subunit